MKKSLSTPSKKYFAPKKLSLNTSLVEDEIEDLISSFYYNPKEKDDDNTTI